MGTITDRQYFGATPKYHLEIEAGTLTMADYDFNVRLQRGPNAYEVNKNEMIEDQGDYYFILDTTRLGVGPVKVIVTADIPDNDVDGGIRTEIVVINNSIEILPL